jgi:hypothetical protein
VRERWARISPRPHPEILALTSWLDQNRTRRPCSCKCHGHHLLCGSLGRDGCVPSRGFNVPSAPGHKRVWSSSLSPRASRWRQTSRNTLGRCTACVCRRTVSRSGADVLRDCRGFSGPLIPKRRREDTRIRIRFERRDDKTDPLVGFKVEYPRRVRAHCVPSTACDLSMHAWARPTSSRVLVCGTVRRRFSSPEPEANEI